jgi:FlaG/FlaF family flagellin (archaellin)
MPSQLPHHPPRHERGVALVVVVFVLIAVLAGGLAAIAIASGELAATYGYRTHATTGACAQAAIEKIRARMPTLTANDVYETYAVTDPTSGKAFNVTITARHIDESNSSSVLRTNATSSPLIVAPDGSYDAAALSTGGDITNRLLPVSSSSAGASTLGLHVYSVVATCEGPGNSKQEVQLIMRYGIPTP